MIYNCLRVFYYPSPTTTTTTSISFWQCEHCRLRLEVLIAASILSISSLLYTADSGRADSTSSHFTTPGVFIMVWSVLSRVLPLKSWPCDPCSMSPAIDHRDDVVGFREKKNTHIFEHLVEGFGDLLGLTLFYTRTRRGLYYLCFFCTP